MCRRAFSMFVYYSFTATNAQKQDYIEAKIWGSRQKRFPKHCGLHQPKIEELWNNQDTSQSWLSNQTRHAGENGLDKSQD